MMLVHYPACNHAVPIDKPRDQLTEAHYALAGETCPRCRATAPNAATVARMKTERAAKGARRK